MKLKNPMLVVTDIDKSVEFYKKVFGLHVIMDLGGASIPSGIKIASYKKLSNKQYSSFLISRITYSICSP